MSIAGKRAGLNSSRSNLFYRNRTHSICYETHQKAKDILEGRKIDPTYYPVIYGADEKDDWTDPKVWKKVPSTNNRLSS